MLDMHAKGNDNVVPNIADTCIKSNLNIASGEDDRILGE